MKCLVELCTKDATIEALCAHHRKKYLNDQLQIDLSQHKVWDVCSNGHRWTESNIQWERIPGRTTMRRRCRKCLALKAKRRRRNDDGTVRPPQPVAPANVEMARAIESFDEALSEGRAKCYASPEKWTDYKPDAVPSAEEAQALCAGCPLYEACDNAAVAQRPGWGVWAGKVWYLGLPLLTNAQRQELLDNEQDEL